MKKIEALVRTSRLDDIVERLRLIGMTGLTVTEAHGMSRSTTSVTVVQGQRLQKVSAPRYQLMVVVRDEDATHVVAAILRTARTDAPGDGIITVTDVDGAMRIRTNELDADAILKDFPPEWRRGAKLARMCARFTLRKKKLREIADELEAELGPDDEPLYRARYNVAPTDLAWIVDRAADARVLRPATWSYVVGDGARRLVNVRGESVGSGAGFREAFAGRRCVVVTDGFYEWPAAKGQAPTLFHRAEDGLVLLGGLFQRPRGGDAHPRFTVLTTRPNATVARVHDRMPVVVSLADLDRWLAGEPARAAALIAPAPDDALVGTLVSKHVNNVRNDDAACVVPAEGA